MKNRTLSLLILFLCFSYLFLACERKYADSFVNHDLPVVALSIDEQYLWSSDSGLYVMGQNTMDNPNFEQKWEHPASFEFIGLKDSSIEHNVGFRIKGNSIRNSAVKSFGLYWRSKYGKSYLNYPIFQDNSIDSYKRLLLRASTSDFTHIRDVATTAIIKDYVNLDYQAYQACALYLNEEYWGLYYLREMITPHHFQNHYGFHKDSIDLLQQMEENPSVDDGTSEDFLSDVIAYLANHELSDQVHYLHIDSIIDISSYIDYIIVNSYIAKGEWPWSNGKWWHSRGSEPYHKWRWVFYDADWSFRLDNVEDIYLGEIYGSSYEDGVIDNFYILEQLWANHTFREEFLVRYQFFVSVVFEVERVERIVNDCKDNIEEEYQKHSEKWEKCDGLILDYSIKEMVKFTEKRNLFIQKVIDELSAEV